MSTNQIINDIEPRTQIISGSAQTVFNVAWTADVAASVLVYARASGVPANDATQLVADSHYNVTFIGASETVRVTFTVGRPLGDIITIVRATDSSRTNLYTNTNFTPSMLNQDFGTETMVQQQNQMYGRDFAPHYNFSATYTNTSDTNIDLILPILEANQVWVKNPSNTAMVAATLSGSGIGVETVTGTVNEVLVNNADAVNPIVGLPPAISAPGTFTIQGTVALDAVIDDNSFATATDRNVPTSESIKAYVDSVAGGGFTVILTCLIGTTANLTGTYANGVLGVGATLTNNSTQVALTIDGVLTQVADRILVKDQTSQLANGVYTVTTVGDGATDWVLTRATDYDTAAEIIPGTLVPVSSGTVNSGSTWLETATVTTVGTDPIVFSIYSQPGGDGGGSNPIGSVASFALTSAPTGYLVCDGAAISRATYADLFSAIGTTWGVGDGATTFNIPDMQRKTGVGSGGAGTVTLGNSVGDTGGAEDITLTTAQMPAHTHSTRITANTGTGVAFPTGSGFLVEGVGVTGSTGGGGSHSNIQPSAILLICIKSSADSSIASGGNVGDFVDFGGTSVPAGCLVRDGAAVSRTAYAALFTVIGTTYGIGDGSTTFNLPDSQRRVSVGSGGVGTVELGNSVGDPGGTEGVTLVTDDIPAVFPYTNGGITNQLNSNTGAAGYVPATGSASWTAPLGNAHNNIQPSLVILPCIRFEGVAATVAVSASQAQMEAASSSAVFSAPAVQQFHPSAAKAWVQFDGAGVVAINASYNVTSITDNGTGDYTVNFTTAFSSINYSAIATCGGGVSVSYTTGTAVYVTGPQAIPTASAWRFGTGQGSVSAAAGQRVDGDYISVVFLGDQA